MARQLLIEKGRPHGKRGAIEAQPALPSLAGRRCNALHRIVIAGESLLHREQSVPDIEADAESVAPSLPLGRTELVDNLRELEKGLVCERRLSYLHGASHFSLLDMVGSFTWEPRRLAGCGVSILP
jgi:hypothetical protein